MRLLLAPSSVTSRRRCQPCSHSLRAHWSAWSGRAWKRTPTIDGRALATSNASFDGYAKSNVRPHLTRRFLLSGVSGVCAARLSLRRVRSSASWPCSSSTHCVKRPMQGASRGSPFIWRTPQWLPHRLRLAQISPDGRRVAFIVRSQGRDADTRIWLRSLGALEAQPVSGTEGARSLFWSPDGQQIAFATESALKRLTMGRTVETLCNACKPVRGGTWSRSGSIVFPSQDGGLLSIPDGGGEPQPVTSLDRAQDEIAHIAPQFLPDGRRFLYVIRSTQANRTGLYVGQVGRNEPRLLLRGEHPAIYAAPGYLLFTRAGNIVAQPFDLRRLELSGEATSLVGRSEYSPTPLQGGDITSLISSGVWPSFSVSETGILTYAIAEHPDSQFQWRERAGEQPLQLLYQPGPYMTFDLSPDGTRLVFARRGEHSSLWVIDLASGVATPLTFGASSYSSPRWASDAQGVVAHRTQPPPLAVVRIQPDGGESVVSGAENCMMDDVSKDGRFVLCRPPVERVLMAIPLSDGQKPITVRKAAGSMDQAQFSPDGRWIAYNADDSGRHEVYVTAFPPTGAAPRPVSQVAVCSRSGGRMVANCITWGSTVSSRPSQCHLVRGHSSRVRRGCLTRDLRRHRHGLSSTL